MAFDSDRDGTRGIYLVRSDGTGLVRFTKSSFVEKEPAFSPDGSKLAYTSNASGTFQIHVLDFAAKTSVQLTSRPYGAIQAAWSRDGSVIAFIGLPQSGDVDAGATYPPPGVADLFVIRPDGTGEKDVYGPSTSSYAWYPAYYPFTPTFGPDPSVIVFGGAESIHAVNTDGSGYREIAGTMTEGTETPTVSPDGTLVAFSTVGALHTTAFASDCIDPYHNCSTTISVSVSGRNRRPAWGPNDILAFETLQGYGTPADIALVPVSGGSAVLLTNDSADDRNPTWAPSGFSP